MKIGRGILELLGRKLPSPIDLVYGLFNSLYYRKAMIHNTT